MGRVLSPERIELPDSDERLGVRPFVRYISDAVISRRTRELAAQVAEDYNRLGITDLHMISIAIGGMYWSVDFAREIGKQKPNLNITNDVVRLGSYGQGTATSGVMREYGTIGDSVAGRHVMVVDEVVDTGGTLTFFLNRLRFGELDGASGDRVTPASLAVAALVTKPAIHNGRVEINYPGIAVPGNPWLVGYGMDHQDHGRNLTAVYQSARPQDTLAHGYTFPLTTPVTRLQVA